MKISRGSTCQGPGSLVATVRVVRPMSPRSLFRCSCPAPSPRPPEIDPGLFLLLLLLILLLLLLLPLRLLLSSAPPAGCHEKSKGRTPRARLLLHVAPFLAAAAAARAASDRRFGGGWIDGEVSQGGKGKVQKEFFCCMSRSGPRRTREPALLAGASPRSRRSTPPRTAGLPYLTAPRARRETWREMGAGWTRSRASLSGHRSTRAGVEERAGVRVRVRVRVGALFVRSVVICRGAVAKRRHGGSQPKPRGPHGRATARFRLPSPLETHQRAKRLSAVGVATLREAGLLSHVDADANASVMPMPV
ncbi:hypothetical protein JHW43_004905 [Diplocarpon mali]|nr:hypothetical protein JHW43_004905 [Diplocarpon mali]